MVPCLPGLLQLRVDCCAVKTWVSDTLLSQRRLNEVCNYIISCKTTRNQHAYMLLDCLVTTSESFVDVIYFFSFCYNCSSSECDCCNFFCFQAYQSSLSGCLICSKNGIVMGQEFEEQYQNCDHKTLHWQQKLL